RLMFLTLAALCVTWDAARVPAPATQRRRAWQFVPAAIALVIAAVAIQRLCVIPFRDNLVLRDLEQRSQIAGNADALAAAPLARANLTDFARIARSYRLDPQWYMLYGANCELLERWQEAADAYTRALTIDQRPEIYFSRGLVLLHLGQVDRAATDMITAVRFNPALIDGIDGELRARVAAGAGL